MATWDFSRDDVKDNIIRDARNDRNLPANVRDLLENVLSTFPANRTVKLLAYNRTTDANGEFVVSLKTY